MPESTSEPVERATEYQCMCAEGFPESCPCNGSRIVSRVRLAGGRSIRPFRLRKLLGDLALVNTRLMTMNENVIELAGQPPWEVVAWRQMLGRMITTLEGIEEACQAARSTCNELFDSADHDHDIAQRAALALLQRDEELHP